MPTGKPSTCLRWYYKVIDRIKVCKYRLDNIFSIFFRRFEWVRTSVVLGSSQVYITWEVPEDVKQGEYRIKHFGYYRYIFGGVYPYEGVSNTFKVSCPIYKDNSFRFKNLIDRLYFHTLIFLFSGGSAWTEYPSTKTCLAIYFAMFSISFYFIFFFAVIQWHVNTLNYHIYRCTYHLLCIWNFTNVRNVK